MAENAHINRLEPVEAYLQHILKCQEQIHRSVLEIKNEIHRRQHIIEQQLPKKLNQELYEEQLKLKDLKTIAVNKNNSEIKELIQKCKTRIYGIEHKLEILKKWRQKLSSLLDVHQSQFLKLKKFSEQDLERAQHLLKDYLKIINEYNQIKKK